MDLIRFWRIQFFRCEYWVVQSTQEFTNKNIFYIRVTCSNMNKFVYEFVYSKKKNVNKKKMFLLNLICLFKKTPKTSRKCRFGSFWKYRSINKKKVKGFFIKYWFKNVFHFLFFLPQRNDLDIYFILCWLYFVFFLYLFEDIFLLIVHWKVYTKQDEVLGLRVANFRLTWSSKCSKELTICFLIGSKQFTTDSL